MNKFHTIWSNEIDEKDWIQDYKDHCLDNGISLDEDFENSNAFYEWINDSLNTFIDDERINLDIQTSNTILAIADLGTWQGRRSGYKECGKNIGKLLYSDCGYSTWYCDRYDFKFKGAHHDGTNYIVYREIKDEKYLELVQDKIYNGTITKSDITRYTRSLKPYIQKVYGF